MRLSQSRRSAGLASMAAAAASFPRRPPPMRRARLRAEQRAADVREEPTPPAPLRAAPTSARGAGVLSGRTRQRPPMPSDAGSGGGSGPSRGRRGSGSRQSRGALARGGEAPLGGRSPQPPAPPPWLPAPSGAGCVGGAGPCHLPLGCSVSRGGGGYSPCLPPAAVSPRRVPCSAPTWRPLPPPALAARAAAAFRLWQP